LSLASPGLPQKEEVYIVYVAKYSTTGDLHRRFQILFKTRNRYFGRINPEGASIYFSDKEEPFIQIEFI